MSKKDLAGGLQSLLGGEGKEAEVEQKPKRGRGRPRLKPAREDVRTASQKGLTGTDTRATFIIPEELLADIKAIAYWDRLTIKEVVETALRDAVHKYEKKNGKVEPIPKR